MNYQERECVVVECEESWWWFSVMLMNFFVINFRLESEFQSSDCFQRTAMMFVYGSGLWSAQGSSLRGSVQLACKIDASSLGRVKWHNDITESRVPSFSHFPPFSPKISQGFPDFAGPRATADSESRGKDRRWARCAETSKTTWCSEASRTTVSFKLMPVQAQWQSGAN